MSIEIFDRTLLGLRRARVADQNLDLDFLMRHVAEDLAMRVMSILRDFETVVDLGAHRGAVSAALGELEKVGHIIALDQSRELLASCKGMRVCADEEMLPLKAQSVDLVVSALTLQHVNDLPGTLLQINRALRPDGLFLGVLPGGRSLHELRSAFMMAESEIEGGSSPRVAPFADVRALGGLLQRAGFALPVIDSDILTVTYSDPIALMKELRAMGWGNALMERRKTFLKRSTLMRACEIYIEEFGLENGRVPASFEFITLTAWAPHESQQKPLRPGAANTRLADALGGTEISTGEKAGFTNKE